MPNILGNPFFNGEPSFSPVALGPPFLKAPLKGSRGNLPDAPPTRHWKGLSRASSGSERNFCFSELQPPESGAFGERHHPIDFRRGLFDSPIPNYLRPVTQTSLLHPGKPQRPESFSDVPPTLRDHSLLRLCPLWGRCDL